MAKKVLGIILTVVGGLSILFALVFGIVFGGVSTVMNESSNMNDGFVQDSTTVSCNGEVVYADDGETHVQYEVSGEIYVAEFNIYSSNYTVGTAVTVYYNENKPEECSVPEITEDVFGMIGGMFAGFGIGFAILFGVVGIILLIVGILLLKKSDTDSKMAMNNMN